jgi:hypothetical protein
MADRHVVVANKDRGEELPFIPTAATGVGRERELIPDGPKPIQVWSAARLSWLVRLFGVRMFFVAEFRPQQRVLPARRREAAGQLVGAVGQVEPFLRQFQEPALVAHAGGAIGQFYRIGGVTRYSDSFVMLLSS